ncbi:MAG: nuclear transport factor 2 family protein [Anaerolineaceae bacterium]|nr:nuclear transport factor 2 family protein [Anaerolineaceae bacterium]
MSIHNNDAEKEAIREAIMGYYHEGHAKNDAAYYQEILHPEWRFFVLDGDKKLCIVDRDEYMTWYDPKDFDATLQWETEFYSIDVTGHLAAVKLRLECQKNKYIDYFNMMKLDGQWWIVHKMSYPVNKESQ